MAPKKSHGPRGNQKKAQAPAVPDSDHIVFTNNPNATKRPEKNEAPAAPRPDARKIIGGASWTGKLPVNLLSELCQRQKWNKPEYSMRKLPGDEGYRSTVTLSATNPKTKELTTLPAFHLPSTHVHLSNQETPLEARHFAATYALFRVSSMKNIHMTLPPQYRDLWKGVFAQLKQEDVDAGRAWKYDADPFAAEAKRQQIHVDMEKRTANAAKAKASSESVNLVMPGRGGRPDHQWDRAPKIEMGRKIRADIEQLVKSNIIWNPYGSAMSEAQRSSIINELANLGFRRSHVEEAVQECKDREETLEWLLIHVPEDDLPRWSFPEGYTAGISLASGDLAKEAKIKRLALGGYSVDECARALKAHDGDEGCAAQELQDQLVSKTADKCSESACRQDADAWKDELNTLEAIFGERYASADSRTCSIVGHCDMQMVPATFHFREPETGYPSVAPIVSIQAELPAYIRLSATRQAVTFAQSNLLGGAMIFNIVEWLETNLPSICENPGPLRDVSLSKPDTMHQTSFESTGDIWTKEKRATSLKLKPGERQSGVNKAPPHMLMQRQSLPAWNKQQAIIDAISTHQCVIISGETGSGKSTQSVQFVLDHLLSLGSNANFVCTQPRRVAAISLADRVSSERGSAVGEEVGYVIRGDAKVSARTRITFMTTGVLLRRLSSGASTAQSDMVNALADITHIFVDEVHERSLDTDFLLALLKNVLEVRRNLKVVLMSATLDASLFSDYFGGSGKVGQVHIPGRTFPVTDVYLDDIVRMTRSATDETDLMDDDMNNSSQSDGQRIRSLGMGINYDLIAELVGYIDEELRRESNPGGILIFLPGTLEIDRTLTNLRGLPIHGLPLHASLTPAEQRQVFHPAPAGKRKVIASTNVAETSITIDDIVAVIDTGRVKETNYDPKDSIVRLEEVWASHAACKQRRGRAGRVQAGTCYKLFTRKVESSMAARPQPEIRRVPLEQLCLSVKATGPDRDVAQFLRRTLTPPEDQAIEVAMMLLHRIGALDDNHLTGLGRYLAIIPADLRCAKLLVYGSIFSCMDACFTIAAILTCRSPFTSPRDKREEAKEARSSFSHGHGDLLLDMAAYNSWREESTMLRYRDLQRWCAEKFLSLQTLRDISSTKSQLIGSLKETNIIPLDYTTETSASYQTLNVRSQDTVLLRALIAGALNPQIARIEFPDRKFAASMGGAVALDPDAKTIKYFSQDNGRVFVHPSSILFDTQTYSGSAAYVSYFSKMATTKTFIRDLTPFNAYGLLLFGGPIELDTHGSGLLVDGWLRLRGWARIGVLVSRLRILLDEALRKRIDNPGIQTGDDGVISIVRRLVEFIGQDQ